MKVGVHIIVSGMVQGVGFRYYVYGKAKQLGISGYVSNLDNGSVEIAAEAERSLIEELIKEIKVGPRYADVTDMRIEWRTPNQQFNDFKIQ